MKDGERGRLILNYGKKEWLDNTLPDPHPCKARRKKSIRNEICCILFESALPRSDQQFTNLGTNNIYENYVNYVTETRDLSD